MVPFPAALFGLLLLVAGAAVSLPRDLPALHDDTRLREQGTTVTGTVAMVDDERRHGKHSSWLVSTPYVTLPVHGAVTTVELDRYAVVDDPGRYREGQRLRMLVAPHVRSERDISIAEPRARADLEGAVRNDVVLTVVGGVLLAVGAPLLFLQFRPVRRRRRRPRGSGH